MADERHIPFLGFGGGGGGVGDYEHAFELRAQHVPVQSRHFAAHTQEVTRPRTRQRSLREAERSRRWHSRMQREPSHAESDLSSTMSSTTGTVNWSPTPGRRPGTAEVDNMAYVHPKEWSDDRLTLYPQLSSTPLRRAGPQTPSSAPRSAAGAPPHVSGRSQYPLPSDAVPSRGGPLRSTALHVQGYSSQRPPPEHVYQPSRPRERSLDHGNVFRGGRGPAAPLRSAAPTPASAVGGVGDVSCESSYISNDSFESRPPTNPLISKRGIPSISSGIPTMGTSTMHGRYLPGASGSLGPAAGAGAGRFLPAGALSSHYIPGVTGTEKLAHAGCGKEVAFRLKQSPLAGVWRKVADGGCGRRRSGMLLCLLLFCIGLLIGAVSVVLYLTVAPDVRGGEAITPEAVAADEIGDMMSFQGEFTVTNKEYVDGFREPGSDDFRRLATELETELNKLFRASNLSRVYNASNVLSLEPAQSEHGRNVTKVSVLVRLNRPRPDGAVTIGTSFIEGMRNSHRRMWLGRRLNVKLDDISFSVSRSAVPPPPTTPPPPPPIDVRWGPWEPWAPCVPCRPQFTQTRERRCLLNSGPGVLLDPGNIQPCLLLNQGADIEDRHCVCDEREAEEAPRPETPPPPPSSSLPEEPRLRPSHSCDQCEAGQVCVQLSGQAMPDCHTPADADDPLGCGGLCKLDVEQCRQISDNAYQCLDESLCKEDEFRCMYGPCLKKHMRCDGHANCSDWDLSDELNCECDSPDHFQCGNQTSCLPVSLRCNGMADCWDGFDEVDCPRAGSV